MSLLPWPHIAKVTAGELPGKLELRNLSTTETLGYSSMSHWGQMFGEVWYLLCTSRCLELVNLYRPNRLSF